MNPQVITGNHAAGYALSLAGEANRHERGVVCGIYPITPQTEIVEWVAKFQFTKGKVITVESEHSAMGVCIGASLHGARAFTASASNGLAYMAENILVAGYYRCPIVMIGVNRTMGPPWNIWADQGDTLMMRDMAWIQFYCDSNQDVLDTTLLAFRLAEDPRILLPVMVNMDAFIVSHTAMATDIPTQEQVDAFLPGLQLPHRLNLAAPVTVGGLAWPKQTMSHRINIDQTMGRVVDVVQEHMKTFSSIFDRSVTGPLIQDHTDDAEFIIIASGTVATTARNVARDLYSKGIKIGIIQIKMFRPFPTAMLIKACRPCAKIAVLDRNYAAGSGGIFCQEVRAALQSTHRGVIQGYLTGVAGGDVTPDIIHSVIADLKGRSSSTSAIWMGASE